MITGAGAQADQGASSELLTRVTGPGRLAYWLSAGLSAVAAASALLTYLFPVGAARNGTARHR